MSDSVGQPNRFPDMRLPIPYPLLTTHYSPPIVPRRPQAEGAALSCSAALCGSRCSSAHCFPEEQGGKMTGNHPHTWTTRAYIRSCAHIWAPPPRKKREFLGKFNGELEYSPCSKPMSRSVALTTELSNYRTAPCTIRPSFELFARRSPPVPSFTPFDFRQTTFQRPYLFPCLPILVPTFERWNVLSTLRVTIIPFL